MNKVLVGENGEYRCSTCGGDDLFWRRTAKGRVWEAISWIPIPGFNAPVPGANQKLKCRACGAYNSFTRHPLKMASSHDVAAATVPSPAATWQADPTGRHEMRYWDGSAWTGHVSDNGITATDPMPA
jgi:hypothetical protein